MNQFKDFNIITEEKGFVGDKIKMDRILNREIVVIDYRIENSKFKQGDKCLYLQIKIGEIYHVVFTSAAILMRNIQKIPKENFPFTATIVKENDRFEFK